MQEMSFTRATTYGSPMHLYRISEW